ncbi:hypothetical protein [Roseomonas chloroacetimidivorans]|jgi:hypothetical protein|uniref:hypothetical protein n=1 Tax=Roseomonas chloroacetimidivorans TaxID=1766656 RepID=UPI003C780E51
MSDRPDSETMEERIQRLERQRVAPAEEVRKVPREAEDRMETAEDEAARPPEGTGLPRP